MCFQRDERESRIGTHDGLNGVGESVGKTYDDRSFLGVGSADLVDPWGKGKEGGGERSASSSRRDSISWQTRSKRNCERVLTGHCKHPD